MCGVSNTAMVMGSSEMDRWTSSLVREHPKDGLRLRSWKGGLSNFDMTGMDGG